MAYFREQGATTGLEKIETLHPFQLSILASPDGAHYQMSWTPSLEETNKSGWCDKAIFTDERAVIFVGAGLGSEAVRNRRVYERRQLLICRETGKVRTKTHLYDLRV